MTSSIKKPHDEILSPSFNFRIVVKQDFCPLQNGSIGEKAYL